MLRHRRKQQADSILHRLLGKLLTKHLGDHVLFVDVLPDVAHRGDPKTAEAVLEVAKDLRVAVGREEAASRQ